jgi:secondary thiamine-phosphate synthase enzyme
VHQTTLTIHTPGRSLLNITERVAPLVTKSGVGTGLCHLFLRHTSASLLLSENADPVVGQDLERFMQRIVPDSSPEFRHVEEGPDDMPAHVRTLLAGASLTLPIGEGRLLLGTWQGIFLWEHRYQGHRREVVVTLMGQ